MTYNLYVEWYLFYRLYFNCEYTAEWIGPSGWKDGVGLFKSHTPQRIHT